MTAFVTGLAQNLTAGLSAASTALSITNQSLSNLTAITGQIDASLANATSVNSAQMATLQNNLLLFQNQTAAQFAYEDEQRAKLAANLTDDLQSLYSTMTTDMQNAFEALREDSQRNNVILAIRLCRHLRLGTVD